MDYNIASSPQNYQTVDVSDAKQQLLQHFDEHQIIPLNPPSFLFRVDAYPVGKLQIYHIEFVGGVELRDIVNHDDVIIHLLLSNYVEVRVQQHWKRLEAPTVFTLTPSASPDFRFPEGGRMLILQVNNDILDQQARQLVQPSPQHPLHFSAQGASIQATHNLQSTFEFMFTQYNNLQDESLRELWLTQADQFMLSQILLNLDNNFTEQLHYRHQHKLPSTLRKACEWLQTVLDQPFNIGELCQATETSQRSLQYQFKQHFNCSPRAYFQAMKLDALHRELIAANHSNSVTELAMKWGFHHSGRLAEQYRQRFGELPSQTLRQ
jgi:AraC-like DNA-binding protein